MEWHQSHPRKCTIMVSQGNQWGWNPSLVQSQQQPDPERNNPHTLVSGESGLMYLTSESRINVGMSTKLPCRPGASKLLNLISNHHTRITRFNAYCRFRVNCVIWWNWTWKRRTFPPCWEGRGIRWLSANPSKLYAPPYRWDGWGTADWVAEDSVHTWHGPTTITRLYICLPQVSSKGLQWCKSQWLSPQG